MQGKSNMGTLMLDMMAGVAAPPSEEGTRLLAAHLGRNAKKTDPAADP